MGDGVTGTVMLSDFDTGGGVNYVAGSGDKTISGLGDSNFESVNLTGTANDLVQLGNGMADTVTFGSGVSRAAAGTGGDNFVFTSSGITTGSGNLDQIVYFHGAGNASSSVADKDFIHLTGFAAGSTLQFVSNVNMSGSTQLYHVVASDGHTVEGAFDVSVVADVNTGLYNHLSSTTDYQFS
jgi:hypothetical protein